MRIVFYTSPTFVSLVNNTSIIREDATFLFSTLWSKINPAYEYKIERSMSDFHVIKYGKFRLSAQPYNELHDLSLLFIDQELTNQMITKKVVVTHHVPTLMNYPEKYKGDVLNEAFAVELFDLIEATNPDYWIYGHTHENTPDFKIGKTRLLTNQLGYVMNVEQTGFSNDRNFII